MEALERGREPSSSPLSSPPHPSRTPMENLSPIRMVERPAFNPTASDATEDLPALGPAPTFPSDINDIASSNQSLLITAAASSSTDDQPSTSTPFISSITAPTPIIPSTPPTPLAMPTSEHRTATRSRANPKPIIVPESSPPKRHTRGTSRNSAASQSNPSPVNATLQSFGEPRRASTAGSRGTSVGARSRKSATPAPAVTSVPHHVQGEPERAIKDELPTIGELLEQPPKHLEQPIQNVHDSIKVESHEQVEPMPIIEDVPEVQSSTHDQTQQPKEDPLKMHLEHGEPSQVTEQGQGQLELSSSVDILPAGVRMKAEASAPQQEPPLPLPAPPSHSTEHVPGHSEMADVSMAPDIVTTVQPSPSNRRSRTTVVPQPAILESMHENPLTEPRRQNHSRGPSRPLAPAPVLPTPPIPLPAHSRRSSRNLNQYPPPLPLEQPIPDSVMLESTGQHVTDHSMAHRTANPFPAAPMSGFPTTSRAGSANPSKKYRKRKRESTKAEDTYASAYLQPTSAADSRQYPNRGHVYPSSYPSPPQQLGQPRPTNPNPYPVPPAFSNWQEGALITSEHGFSTPTFPQRPHHYHQPYLENYSPTINDGRPVQQSAIPEEPIVEQEVVRSPKRQKLETGYRPAGTDQTTPQTENSQAHSLPMGSMEGRYWVDARTQQSSGDVGLPMVQEEPVMSERQNDHQEPRATQAYGPERAADPLTIETTMATNEPSGSAPVVVDDSSHIPQGDNFHITTPEDYPSTDPTSNSPNKGKTRAPRRQRKTREVTTEDIPNPPKDKVKEKEETEKVEKPEDDEDEESKGYPTEPNFQFIFHGKWKIIPWYFSPYPLFGVSLQRVEDERDREHNALNAGSFPGGRFTKGNQVNNRKAAASRKRAISVINGEDTNTNGSVDGRSEVAKSAKKDEPLYASGHTLWVCETCFKYCDRPLEGYQCADGRKVLPHWVTDCTVRRIPGTLMYDDGRDGNPKMAPNVGAENALPGASVHHPTAAMASPQPPTLVPGMNRAHSSGVHPHSAINNLQPLAPAPYIPSSYYLYPSSSKPPPLDYAAQPAYNPTSDVRSTSEQVPQYPYATNMPHPPVAPTSYPSLAYNSYPPAPAVNTYDSPVWNHQVSVPDTFPLKKANFPSDSHYDGPMLNGHHHAQPQQHATRYPSYPNVWYNEQGIQLQGSEGRRRIYEIDSGKHPEHKLFCQNLALFGKFFLKGKFVFYECHDFIFYIITSVQNGIETVVGFFTKEKDLTNENNLACIIVFPPYQNKGFGSLMIKFSYELSKRDNKVGSPEKPLSDLGLRSYYTVWANSILDYILEQIKVDNTVLDRAKGSKRTPKQRKTLGNNRSYSVIESYDDGSAHVHLSFECTLQQLADAAFLTVADASFALNELGIVWYTLGGTKAERPVESSNEAASNAANGKVVLTRDLIHRLAKRWRFRKTPLNTAHLLF